MNSTIQPDVTKVLQLRFWTLVLFLSLGTFSSALLFWSIRISERELANFARADAIMDLRFNIAVSHLWFEEAIYGDRDVDMQEVWGGFDEGLRLVRTMIDGGATEQGLALEPFQEADLRDGAKEMERLMVGLKSVALERYKDPARGGIGSILDQEFDSAFKAFNQRGRAMEVAIERDQFASQQKSRSLFIWIFLAWGIMMGAASVGLWTREKRRLAAELALKKAHDQLQVQAGELKKHKEHLTELVREQTEELTATNHHLTREIIEHKETVVALQESNGRYEKLSSEFQGLLQAIPDSLVLLSPDLKVLWANSGAVSSYSGSNGASPRRTCYEMTGDRLSPCTDCPAPKAFRTGKTEGAQIARPDGTIWEVRAVPIRSPGGEVRNVIEVATDVSEKVALQTESLRMAHLASMGELAAGVAHEINNPVNGIINYAEILTDELQVNEEARDMLARIVKESDRIATIVRSLLSFAHQEKTEKMSVCIQDVLADALSLSGKQMEKEGILFTASVPARLPAVVANANQIEQVFLNIISNARYALNLKFPGSNESKILSIHADTVSLHGVEHVHVTFHDRGTGIPAAIKDKLMAPFFSTKPKGFGAGLGLSISHGIVSDHGGKLTFESVEGEFTKAHVFLPVERDHDG